MPILDPTHRHPEMSRLTREPYSPIPAKASTKCAYCGAPIRAQTNAFYYPRRDVYSHINCRVLDVDDFEMGYFTKTRGEVYEVKGRCIVCEDPVFAHAWVFSSGDILFHFACALPLVRGSFDPDADLRGHFFLPRRPGKAA